MAVALPGGGHFFGQQAVI